MNDHVKATILSLVTMLCAISYPVTVAWSQDDGDRVLAVPDFDDMPDMRRLLAEGTGITTATLSELGYATITEDEYEKCFAAPKDVANADSTSMLVAANFLFIMQTGEVQQAGSVAVIAIDGDHFTVSTTPNVTAGPSFWKVGDNGMIEEVAPSEDVPGALTKLKYRSADLDYDLYYYSGEGKTFLERIMRKSTQDEPRTWTVAVQRDGVYYSKSIVMDAEATDAVETPQPQK
jgi:hypothetical protein